MPEEQQSPTPSMVTSRGAPQNREGREGLVSGAVARRREVAQALITAVGAVLAVGGTRSPAEVADDMAIAALRAAGRCKACLLTDGTVRVHVAGAARRLQSVRLQVAASVRLAVLRRHAIGAVARPADDGFEPAVTAFRAISGSRARRVVGRRASAIDRRAVHVSALTDARGFASLLRGDARAAVEAAPTRGLAGRRFRATLLGRDARARLAAAGADGRAVGRRGTRRRGRRIARPRVAAVRRRAARRRVGAALEVVLAIRGAVVLRQGVVRIAGTIIVRATRPVEMAAATGEGRRRVTATPRSARREQGERDDEPHLRGAFCHLESAEYPTDED